MINSRESANKYYKLVNEIIEKYINDWKIRPSKLEKYLKIGGEKYIKLLQRNGLMDVKGINRVFKDVIEDYVNIEKDGILTFENHRFYEQTDYTITDTNECFTRGIGKADINHEKILADYFKLSLSNIEVINSSKHTFKLDDWDREAVVIVYTKEELNIISENFKELRTSELMNKYLNFMGNKIEMSKVVDEAKFKARVEEIFESEDFRFNLFTNHLQNDGVPFNLVYKGEHYSIWMV